MREQPGVYINEAQLLLAEKRTSLASLRTGLTVLGLPLALVSFLIAFSKNYDASEVSHYLAPVLAVCAGLLCLGVYLLVRAVIKLHRADQMLQRLKKEHPVLRDYLV